MIDVTKFTAPFGLLDEVYGPGAQEALKAWPHGLGIYLGYGKWASVDVPSIWFDTVIYRGRPAPLTKPSIDWTHVAPQWVAMATYEDGKTYLFEREPCWHTDGWFSGFSCRNADLLASFRPGTCRSEDSLVRRPEGV